MGVLAELYKTSLTKAIGHQAVVFNYGADFNELWKEADDSSPSVLSRLTETQDRFVIVWDGKVGQEPPSGFENLLSRHLTPLDWALALSIKMLGAGNVPRRALRIHIIDLSGKKHDEWSIRLRHTLLAEMPWVTIHAPLIPTMDDGTRAPYRAGYEPIVDGLLQLESNGLRQLRSLGRSPTTSAAKNLIDLAQQWAATLTHSDDHHDLNNIIGPGILASDDCQTSGLSRTLLTRLSWCNPNFKALIEWSPWPVDEEVKSELFGRPLSLFVVDDQLRHGWGRFICRLLGEQFDEGALYADNFSALTHVGSQSQKVKVFGSISADPLIRFLETASFDRRDFSQQLVRTADGIPTPEIVFLDLRLYAKLDDARACTRQLLDIVAKRVQAPLAWPAVSDIELARIRKWSGWEASPAETTRQEISNSAFNKLGFSDAYMADEALLLMPRLLALALPLTPIILFSSTTQAWLKERLKPYPNVFTTFEKPRVLSSSESIRGAIDALKDGLGKSVAMMRLRLQLAHAQIAYGKAAASRPAKIPLQREANTHIEIYADETGKPDITSGMAVCVFRDLATAESLQQKLMAEFHVGGNVWATKIGSNLQPKLNKGEYLIDSKTADVGRLQTDQVRAVLSLLSSAGISHADLISWSVVATKTKLAPPVRDANDISLAAFPDASLDTAIRHNLEFAIYVLVPYLIVGNEDGAFDGTIQIHLPTRIIPKEPQVAQAICDAFDLGAPRTIGKDPRRFIATYSSCVDSTSSTPVGSAFPLIRGWLHEWRDAETVKPTCIRKVKIARLGRGTGKGITPSEALARRLFHDVADWVCSASTKRWKGDDFSPKFRKEMGGLFPNWFVSTDLKLYECDFNNALLLMRALRATCGGARNEGEIESLRLILQNSYIKACDDRLIVDEHCVQQRIILWVLRREIESSSGPVLHALIQPNAGK